MRTGTLSGDAEDGLVGPLVACGNRSRVLELHVKDGPVEEAARLGRGQRTVVEAHVIKQAGEVGATRQRAVADRSP